MSNQTPIDPAAVARLQEPTVLEEYEKLLLQFKQYKLKFEQMEDIAKISQAQATEAQKICKDAQTVLGRVKILLVEHLTDHEKVTKLQQLLGMEPVQDHGLVDRMIEQGKL